MYKTTTFKNFQSQETSGVLFEIKQNPQCLEDNFTKLMHNGFSSQMCQLIRDMLRRNFQQRPTAVLVFLFIDLLKGFFSQVEC